MTTEEFERYAPIDEQMDFHEKLRLLYVAMTRARDHLVVSVHRPAKAPGDDRTKLLDGAAGGTRAVAFFRIALPLALPGVLTVGVLIAIAAWSEYFVPLLLAGPSTTPATVGVVNFIGVDTINWGALAAAALTLVVPVFIVTLL